jgi:hypothetical protein
VQSGELGFLNAVELLEALIASASARRAGALSFGKLELALSPTMSPSRVEQG